MDASQMPTPPLGQELPQAEKSNKKKILIIILIIVGAVAIFALGALAGYFLYQPPTNSTNAANEPTDNQSNNDNEPNQTDQQSEVIPYFIHTDETIEVAWSKPTPIDSLQIFSATGFSPEKEAKYYQVGTINQGSYQGAALILVIAGTDGPGGAFNTYRLIKQNDQLIYLQKYSDYSFSEESDVSHVGLNPKKFTVATNYTIAQLDYPQTLYNPDNKTTLELDPYYDKTTFSVAGLKKVFTDPKYGAVYTSTMDDSKNLFQRGGFYLATLDGTALVYYLKPNFIDDKAGVQITWSDGSKNTADYAYTERVGCGGSNYASVIYNLNPDELKVTGTTILGDKVYEFKDSNNALLKNIYDNKYYVYGDEKKISYQEFIANHPLFIWQDPFGRYIKFENIAFGPLAECGKPVIYLYPEQTEKVAVKVEPRGGLTYSDPDYNGGWEVLATPQGQLTELSSGQNYPYLFWEGYGGIYQQPQKGFVIKQNQVHDFLLEKLAQLGLNAQETADFIEFWEPRMQNSPYYFVTFLGNNEMNRLAPLTISPQPDTIIRILMDFSPLSQPITVEGYDIKTPKRQGFTVVEWGGVLQ